MFRSNLLLIRLWLFAACMAVGTSPRADDLGDVRRLHLAGQTSAALERAERILAVRPNDPPMRFLKAVMLADTQRTAEAKAVLQSLTEEFPDLPEPFNNLGALYASTGDLERARINLEQALRNNPRYATAYENLGDVYVALASQAYAQALQLDRANTTAAPKLSLTRELIKPTLAKPALALPATSPVK